MNVEVYFKDSMMKYCVRKVRGKKVLKVLLDSREAAVRWAKENNYNITKGL